tara:strand:- start:166 stop:561 length:396 start_codon:yes stop_codon:yes gene_type:complete
MEKFKIFLKKPIYKKFLMWHLLIIIIIAGAAGGGNSTVNSSSDSGSSPSSTELSLIEASTYAEKHFQGAGQALLDYKQINMDGMTLYLFLTDAGGGYYCIATTGSKMYSDFSDMIINVDCSSQKYNEFYAF